MVGDAEIHAAWSRVYEAKAVEPKWIFFGMFTSFCLMVRDLFRTGYYTCRAAVNEEGSNSFKAAVLSRDALWESVKHAGWNCCTFGYADFRVDYEAYKVHKLTAYLFSKMDAITAPPTQVEYITITPFQEQLMRINVFLNEWLKREIGAKVFCTDNVKDLGKIVLGEDEGKKVVQKAFEEVQRALTTAHSPEFLNKIIEINLGPV